MRRLLCAPQRRRAAAATFFVTATVSLAFFILDCLSPATSRSAAAYARLLPPAPPRLCAGAANRPPDDAPAAHSAYSGRRADSSGREPAPALLPAQHQRGALVERQRPAHSAQAASASGDCRAALYDRSGGSHRRRRRRAGRHHPSLLTSSRPFSSLCRPALQEDIASVVDGVWSLQYLAAGPICGSAGPLAGFRRAGAAAEYAGDAGDAPTHAVLFRYSNEVALLRFESQPRVQLMLGGTGAPQGTGARGGQGRGASEGACCRHACPCPPLTLPPFSLACPPPRLAAITTLNFQGRVPSELEAIFRRGPEWGEGVELVLAMALQVGWEHSAAQRSGARAGQGRRAGAGHGAGGVLADISVRTAQRSTAQHGVVDQRHSAALSANSTTAARPACRQQRLSVLAGSSGDGVRADASSACPPPVHATNDRCLCCCLAPLRAVPPRTKPASFCS